MTHCAKCGAELIGTRKFCTACGAPAGDPRSPAASTGMAPAVSQASPPAPPVAAGPNSANSGPSIQYAPSPNSAVNPFAATAGPKSMPVISSRDYGPPPSGRDGGRDSIPLELASTTPGIGDPSKAPQVSPLAMSNVDPQRGAMLDQMVASAHAARAEAAPDSSPSSVRRGVIPGTQIMPSMANPPIAAPVPGAPAASAPSAPRADKTQLLGAFPLMAPRPSGPQSTPAPAVPAMPVAPQPPAAQSGSYPAGQPAREPSRPDGSTSQPGVPMPRGPSYPDPSSSQPGVPLPQNMYPAPAHVPPPHAGWNPGAAAYPQQPQQPPPPYVPPAPAYPAPAYGYAYPPGTRVSVTWSNGQRYPGTVQQVAGTQCLVVFPDGQHHWVDLQYVSPAV